MSFVNGFTLVTLPWLVALLSEGTGNPCDVNPCQSVGHVCKPLTDTDYQCICVDCDDGPADTDYVDMDPSACDPNPCERDCKCFESCKHAGGYYCRSDAGFLGKNCSVPAPTLRCEADKMILSVSESFVREYDMGLRNSFVYVSPSLHQHSQYCEIPIASNGVYEMVIPQPFFGCNTTHAETKDSIVFSNQMWFNRRVSNAMFDMPIPVAEFRCSYNRAYKVVTSLKPVVSTPTKVSGKKDIFPSISLCKVADCPAACPQIYQVSRGASYTVGEMIHVTMSLDSGSMATGVVDMYLSCSRDPSSSSTVDVVDGGCTGRSGLPSFVRSSFVSDNVCVSFQTPRAIGCNEFYIHALLQSCERSDTERCAASDNLRCRSSTRTKRSTSPVVVIGPLVIINGSAGQPTVNINGMEEYDLERIAHDDIQEGVEKLLDLQEERRSAGGFDTTLIIIPCLAAALLVFLLVPYAYVRSARKQ